VYCTSAVYCRAVIRDFLQLTDFHRSGRYLPCRSS
jgi:hypothetical protein